MAVRILTEDGHDNHIYELTGPDLLNFFEIAQCMSAADRKSRLPMSHKTSEQFRSALAPFTASTWQLDALCILFQEIAEGVFGEKKTSDVETGDPPQGLLQYLHFVSNNFFLRDRH